jgi:trigger factor
MSLTSSVEEINSVQRRVRVAVAPELVNKAFDDAYRAVQKKASLQGFRPGKAPLTVIKKFFKDRVTSDVVDKLINTHLFSILKEKKINPIASPVVEEIKDLAADKEFAFSAVIDIMPEIKISGYKGLKLNADKYEIKEDIITREVDFLRRRNAKTKSVEDNAAAGKGHLASIGHKVFHEGQLIENMAVEEFAVALGFNEIFEDLENAIIGMKVGETKKAMIKLPDTYNDPALAGKTVEFEITLRSLQDLAMPAVDDEFAKDVGFDSVVAMQTSIKDQLEKHAAKKRKQKLETTIMAELRKANNFDVPPSMVDQVIDGMINELQVQDEKEKKKLQKNDDLRRSFRDTAKTKAQNTLILWRIAQDEKLTVSDDAIKKHITDNMPGTDKWEESKLNDLVKNFRPRLEESLLFDLALDHVIDNGVLTETVVPFQ